MASNDILGRRTRLRYGAAFDAVVSSADAQEFAMSIRASVEDYNFWAKSTQRRRADNSTRFARMHQSGKWAHFNGREYALESVLDRAQDFLTFSCQVSQSAADQNQKMSFSSLNTLRYDVVGLMVKYCSEAAGQKALHQIWRDKLMDHIQYIANIMMIPRHPQPKIYFGTAELILLAETAITNCISIDATFQHLLLTGTWLGSARDSSGSSRSPRRLMGGYRTSKIYITCNTTANVK